MSTIYDGRTAIVTGAACGIGAAIAQRLLERGARVVITDLDAERLESTRERLDDAHPGSVRALAGDASAEGDIAASIEVAEEAFGPVDIYVANAGIGDGDGLEASEDRWTLTLDINLLAHVRAARLLVPGWVERGEGWFLSTASAAGLLTQIGSATYSASKHAAVGFAEWLAVTYGADGVHVSCLCPQGVDTDLLRTGMTSGGQRGRAAAAAVTSAGNVLAPLDVADTSLDTLAEGRFLVLPHAEVAEHQRRKAADPDRWIRGMQRYQTMLMEQAAD